MRPRIRSIKPEIWQDEKIVALSRDARLLLLGLVTMADDEGRFRARRSTILGHAFPGDQDAAVAVDAWIAEIREQGLILFYVVDGTPYGAFRHWARHQKVNKPTPSTLPPPPDPKVVRANRIGQKGRPESSRSSPVSLRESSRSSPVEVQEEARSSKSPRAGALIRSDPIQIRSLSLQLAERIRQNDPKAQPNPESKRWLTDMRLLVKDRGGDIAEVQRVIDACQTDSFWRSNILSPAKLRKHFTQLILRARNGQQPEVNPALPEWQRPRPEWLEQVKAHLEAQEA